MMRTIAVILQNQHQMQKISSNSPYELMLLSLHFKLLLVMHNLKLKNVYWF